MAHYAYIKMSNDADAMEYQKDLIDTYIKNEKIKLSKIYKCNSVNQNKIHKYLEQTIDELDSRNDLIVSGLGAFGKSIYKVLQQITRIKEKGIILHLVNESLIFPLDDEVLFKIVIALIKVEKKAKEKRMSAAKETRDNNGTKIGRKGGKKTKSMFDKHKKKIIKLNEFKVPKIEILKEIKSDDDILKNATPQALGQYIKRINKDQRTKKENVKQKNIENFNKSVDLNLGRVKNQKNKNI